MTTTLRTRAQHAAREASAVLLAMLALILGLGLLGGAVLGGWALGLENPTLLVAAGAVAEVGALLLGVTGRLVDRRPLATEEPSREVQVVEPLGYLVGETCA